MLNINWGKINKAGEFFDAGVDTLGQVPGAGLRRAGDAILGTGIYTLSQLKMMQYNDVKNIFSHGWEELIPNAASPSSAHHDLRDHSWIGSRLCNIDAGDTPF